MNKSVSKPRQTSKEKNMILQFQRYHTEKTAVSCFFLLVRICFSSELCAMDNGLTHEQKKDWAQVLFIYNDYTIQNIAKTVDVSEAIVRKWIMEGQWEGMKRCLLTTRAVQLEYLYDILAALTARIKEQSEGNTKDADLLIKYTAAIKNLESETSVPQIIEVAKAFTTWLQHDDLELTKTVTLKFNTYIREQLKK